MFKFIRENPQLLLFGMLTAMFSGPGQTFLVSLFIPHMRDAFGLSQTGISSLYSLATLLSACFLPVLGYLLDRVHLTKFTLVSGILLAAGCVLLSQASVLWVVFIGFFLIRHLGQGSLAIISSTTMARVFGAMRGRALGIANIGFPLSEAIFPFLVSSWILWFDWRSGWILLAVLVLIFFSPAVLILLSGEPQRLAQEKYSENQNLEKEVSQSLHSVEHWSITQVIRDWRFYMLLLPVLIPAFYFTGLFFHQAELMAFKGWSLQVVSAAFLAYAACRAPISFVIGPFIDRYTAKKLFPFSLVPLGLGLLCFWFGNHILWVWFYLGLGGIGMGLGMTISSALWAELYGTKYLGTIRGVLTGLMVLSTALAPILLGYLLDQGMSLEGLLMGLFWVNVLGILLAAFVCYTKKS